MPGGVGGQACKWSRRWCAATDGCRLVRRSRVAAAATDDDDDDDNDVLGTDGCILPRAVLCACVGASKWCARRAGPPGGGEAARRERATRAEPSRACTASLAGSPRTCTFKLTMTKSLVTVAHSYSVYIHNAEPLEHRLSPLCAPCLCLGRAPLPSSSCSPHLAFFLLRRFLAFVVAVSSAPPSPAARADTGEAALAAAAGGSGPPVVTPSGNGDAGRRWFW